MSEQTKEKLKSLRTWCMREGQDYIQNLVRDLKSLRSIWCYVILALFVWVCCYAMLYYAKDLGTAVIYSTAGLAGTVFTGYVLGSNAEKRMANQFPAYTQAIPKVGDTMGPEQDNG